MGEFASKGVAGSGLGLGIAGTALGLLNSSNGGLLGGILGGGNAQSVIAEKDATIARLESEKYSDNSNIEVYKQLRAEMKEQRDTLLGNWIKPLADEAAANKVTLATIQAEQKAEAEKNALREQLMKAEIEKQGLLASQGLQSLQCQINCMNGDIGSLRHTVAHITKTVVPKDAICPEVMPRYNSWTAPTTVTAPATVTAGE